MEKSRSHVYFAVEGDVIYSLSVWGAQRGTTPKL